MTITLLKFLDKNLLSVELNHLICMILIANFDANVVEMKTDIFSVDEVDTAARCLRVGKAIGIDRLTA